MGKLIAAINMTLDGYCDHTAMIADEEIHQHYTALLYDAGAMLYGRTTYQLMESYWPTVVQKPTGNKPIDEFAVAIEDTPKIVFSHTLRKVEWKNSRLATENLGNEAIALKQQSEKDIFIGSPSLISLLTELQLLDEFQLCIHPVIAGGGLPLFNNISERNVLKLLKTKTIGSGAIIHYYEPASETRDNPSP